MMSKHSEIRDTLRQSVWHNDAVRIAVPCLTALVTDYDIQAARIAELERALRKAESALFTREPDDYTRDCALIAVRAALNKEQS